MYYNNNKNNYTQYITITAKVIAKSGKDKRQSNTSVSRDRELASSGMESLIPVRLI